MLRNFNTTAEILKNSKRCSLYVNSCLRWKSDDVVVRIKDVSKRIKSAKNPQYVPRKYLMKEPSQETLKHLRWMLQKDILNQDIFLMGSPGSKRRELALAFLELTQRELEFVSLSRDTTEADLKQRREIQNATANYYDQSAVRAAIHGRILVLEGVEKAERNVLPILNNLLENREMHLEDGRFLIPAARYDKLLKEHSKEELDAWRLVRVDEDFRVIALGLPVPKYSGHSLDPPLRSRFQARLIPAATFKEQLEDLQNSMPNVDSHKLSQLLSSCHALVTPEAVSLGLPDFPLENIKSVVEILDKFPETPVYDLFYRLYPYKLFLNKEGKSAVEDILTTFGILEKRRKSEGNNKKKIIRCEKNEEMKYFASAKILNNDGMEKSYNVLCGTNSQERKSKYIGTTYQDNLLTDMMESHLSSDLCLIGPKGCGKSITVEQLANLLGYEVDPILLYQDMTSRDLIQQRSTLENGDTVWKNSPLVEAALNGKLAILDGIHRIHPSTLAIIHRLVQNRELQLHDGKRLLRHDRYDEIKEEYQKSDDDMKNDGILRIHPAFRLIALAEPVAANSNNAIGSWLNSELLSLFLFHEMRPLSKNEELGIIREKFGEPSESLFNIINLAHDLRSSKDSTLQSLSNSLSTRQLLRIARRLKAYPDDDTHDLVNRTCLARFLPAIPKQALEDSLKKHGIVQDLKTRSAQAGVKQIQCLVTDDTVSIGKTTVERYKTQNLTKVPDILFYDVDQHLRLLEKLMQDFILGENLLLVGNQGVGKNKIVDRLLQVLNRPREYIQLHRDTTVQTLTIQTMVKNGIVVYEDSPLVQAVKFGHVLVIDEADKAPTQVTCILKTLVESGEMTLSDGRRIVPATTAGQTTAPNLIQMHPDFRLIVLANRPGFPFLGNDFFGALGDLFSTHSVDNPSVEDEIQLLRQYGPDVDQEMIQKLVRAFGELRSMSDQGLVSYPYSTREVVNIVRHLQKFPDEPLTNVVRNVFDFDRYSDEVFETLVSILHKHGIPLGANISNVALAKEISLPARLQHLQTWKISENPRVIPVEEKFVKFKAPNYFKTNIHNLDRFESRSVWFTELISHWNVPVHQISTVAGLAISKSKGSDADEKIHVLTASATSDVFSIFSMSRNSQEIREIFIHNLIRPLKGDLPGYTLVSDENGNLLIHEKTSNSLFSLNLEEGFIREFQLSSFFDSAGDKFAQAFRSSRNVDWKFQSTSDPRFAVIFGAEKLEFLDLHKMNVYSMTLPFQIRSVLQVSDRSWLVQDSSSKNYLLSKASDDLACPNILNPIDSIETRSEIGEFLTCNRQDLVHEAPDLESNPFQAPNRILATEKTYVTLLKGFPDSKEAQVEVHSVPKKEEASISSLFQPIVTPAGLLIRGVGTKGIPESVVPQDQRNRFLGSLEFVDPVRNKARYVPVPKPESVSQATQWLYTRHLPFYAALASNQDLVTVDAGGTVRLWETSSSSLSRSLDAWQKMVGADTEKLQLTKERHSGLETSRPKHGRVDEKNDPHVGGNTWAGGTGGRDTAGLGGKGGPYRLDAGHDVHQLSDEEKRAVPEHIQKAAREMGQRTFRQRLQEIQMSEYDHNLYQQFSKPVQRQVQAIRILLGNLQAKSKEREWCRNQTSGELDDTKLIEGLTGEKTIYKRRAEKEPEIGAPQLRPKRLKLVVDVSGSMYRFNGYDARLDREIEAAVMVMEAFNDYEDKIQYDIVGHSGDEYHIPFVDHTKPPKDSKRRLEIVKTMHAHSQFCMSGDHTLEATQHAIQSLAKEETDESIVVVLSDANLERYGIPPEKFAKILTSNPEVNAFAIFIGSLGDQADRLVKRMPSRKAFVCMDLKNIPRILQQIFAASVLSTTRSN